MSDIVIRQITPEITTFSRPFTRFGGLFPMGGRTTAIKLSSGGVWVVASTPLSKETQETVDAMGPVEYILAADADHHFFLSEWKNAYPSARMIGMEGLPEKKKAESWKFDHIYGADASETTYGFESDIQSCYFSGFSKKDVAWLHLPSKTLIVADLIFNLPATEQYSKAGGLPKLSFLFPSFHPYSGFHKKFVWGEGKDKEVMKGDIQTVSGWDFERIIPCHGDVIEKDAKQAWNSAYSKYLS